MMDNRLCRLLQGSTLAEETTEKPIHHFKFFAMKKLFLIAAIAFGFAAQASTPPAEVTERILKAFKETFKAATDITWHEYSDYYQANFRVAEVQIRAQYSDDGTLLKTIRYYGEDQLLPHIVAKLKSKYRGKIIHGVTETTSDSEVSFVINLKDKEHWYTVKSDAYGNLEQTAKFNRADN